MEVKNCVILLLWLAATQGGDCFESARLKKFRERNDDGYTVYVAQIDNTKDVQWFICGKCPDTTEAGEFVCSELKDFTNVSTERYIVHVTHYTDTKEDGWNVRITVEDSEMINVEGSFVCRRLNLYKTHRSNDYFVFVKHISKTYEIGWFVCQKRKRQNYQCSGDDYCNMPI